MIIMNLHLHTKMVYMRTAKLLLNISWQLYSFENIHADNNYIFRMIYGKRIFGVGLQTNFPINIYHK